MIAEATSGTRTRTSVVNSTLVGRVLLERLSGLLDHDLSNGTSKEESETDVLHPVGSQRVGLATRDLVDKDEGVDSVQQTVVDRDKGCHSRVKCRVVGEESPVDL